MASVRICRQCGNEGHDRRNCPELQMTKEEKQRQNSLEKPTLIHIGSYNNWYICGIKSREIPTKYNTDEYMSKLPICEECNRRYNYEKDNNNNRNNNRK